MIQERLLLLELIDGPRGDFLRVVTAAVTQLLVQTGVEVAEHSKRTATPSGSITRWNRYSLLPQCRLRVISGGAGRSPTRQVKLNKRTLTPRAARLSPCSEINTFGNITASCPVNGLRIA